ncbi:MAG: Holliday junction resolvase RecU [Streptococcaceae bacterium]|nr:Holliday junction resolvase RecU [Streptococcaceae bacterium]
MVIRNYPSISNTQDKKYDFEKFSKNKRSLIEFGKRGMNFELAINQSNAYYLTHGFCVVHKKPTPIQIVKVDYPKRSKAKISEAYFKQASTTDYNGVYKGRYLDFEAKETSQKTSFPFSNFHQHQLKHMETVLEQKGLAFVLLFFSSLKRVFYYPAEKLIEQYRTSKRKSLKLSNIEQEGIELMIKIAPQIPYLEAVDTILKGGDSY